MDRAEAIKVLSEWVATGANGDKSCTVSLGVNIDTIDSVFNMAIAALREQEQKRYTTHEVAVILAEFTGDDCACNFNDIDEWLPERCELQDACPNTVGVACWEQYLKYREHELPKEGDEG